MGRGLLSGKPSGTILCFTIVHVLLWEHWVTFLRKLDNIFKKGEAFLMGAMLLPLLVPVLTAFTVSSDLLNNKASVPFSSISLLDLSAAFDIVDYRLLPCLSWHYISPHSPVLSIPTAAMLVQISINSHLNQCNGLHPPTHLQGAVK